MIVSYLMIFLTIIVALIIFSLLVFLLIRKYFFNYFAKKRNNYYEKTLPIVIRYVTGKDERLGRGLNTTSKWQREVITEILYKVSRKITSEEEINRVRFVSQSIGYTDELKQSLIQRKKLIEVSEATKKAGVLRLKDLAPLIEKNLYEDDVDLWLSSARALANMGESSPIIRFLANSERDISQKVVIRIGDMLLRSNTVDENEMMDHFDSASLIVQRVFIETFGRKKMFRTLPIIESCLEHEDLELQVKALKAIGEMGLTTKQDEIMEFLFHPEWVVKVAAINAIHSCKVMKAVDILTELLADENWWVRLRAAEALKGFGIIGKEKLLWTQQFHGDLFAREMAEKVLQSYSS